MHEDEEEAEHEQQRRRKLRPAGPERRDPAEDLHAVGIAIIMLAAVKKLCPSSGRLVANMWCTHRPKPRKPVAISDSTIAV